MKNRDLAILFMGLSLLCIAVLLGASQICFYVNQLNNSHSPNMEDYLTIPSLIIAVGVFLWGLILYAQEKNKN